MAKSRIKGITVEIGGDVTGLDKALSKVNSKISDTQSQLKDVQRALKLDPTNTELLAQKQRLLGDAVKATAEKLGTLKDAEKQAEEQFKQGKISQEQYDALKREIMATERQLKSLETQAAQSNVALEKVGAVADKVAAGANKVADATRGMSTAAAGAIAAIGAAGVSAAGAADDLNTLSKQTGISTDMLQKAKYAADLIDVSYETFTGSITKMVSKLRTNEQGFNDLGIATRDASGELRDTEDIFESAIFYLSRIENETERDIAAQELFGKSAAELAGYIDDGGEAFRNLGEQAENMGLILDGETLGNLNEVNDTLDTLKAQAQASFFKASATVLEAITPVLEKVAGAVTTLLDKLSNLDEKTVENILTVLTIVAAISPVAGIIGKIAGAVSTVTGIVSKIIPVLETVAATIAMNPAVLIIAGIVAAVTALTVVIVKHWDDIKAIIQKAIDWIKNLWAGVRDAFDNIKNKISTVKDAVVAKFTEAIDFIKNLPSKALQWGKDLIKNFIDGITAKWNALKEKVSGVAQTVKDFLGFSEPKLGPLSDFHTYAPDMMKLFAKGIEDNAKLISDQLNKSLVLAPITLKAGGVTMMQQQTQPVTQASTMNTVNIYPQSLDAPTMDYIINRVNSGLGVIA